jgi:hypothetical protein
MTPRTFGASLTAIVLLAILLRGIFPAADPPWRTTVGVVWHDEGAWVHNARNKALWGEWRQDDWNPMFIAPVFTGLEYLSFAAFGVGVRQARLVSEVAGVLSVILMGLGMRRVAGDSAALLAAGLLATSYVYVMYDRAAIMEALMAAFIAASWYGSARAERQPAWGAAAGLMAALAFFTKAAAAFYVGALGLVAVASLLASGKRATGNGQRTTDNGQRATGCGPPAAGNRRRAALWTLAGLVVSFGIVGALFVLPNWTDYQFYNWQMSVTRKPTYDLKSIMDRVTWFPVVHDTFTRMWAVLCLALAGAWSIALGWRRAGDAERLLLLWVAVGTLELLLHDVGNERRYVFLIPAAAALASLVLSRGRVLEPEAASVPRRRLLAASPLLLYCAFVASAPLVRLPFLYEVKLPVRTAAAAAATLTGLLIVFWPRIRDGLTRRTIPRAGAFAIVALVMAGDLVQFAQWAIGRTYRNYEASIALGRVLPEGTLVQGKLANGLSLENRIRPLFIGHGFGNFADRKTRDDVRYILSYTRPWLGYEGSQIADVLEASPGWRIIMTFDVAETPGGHDTAALIEKRARH